MFPLSNLDLGPNLLAKDGYQDAIYRCTVWELADFGRRCPGLFHPARLSTERRAAYRDMTSPVVDRISPKMHHGRRTGWLRAAAAGLAEAVAAVGGRADEQAVVELLLVARQLYHAAPDDPATRQRAAAWDARLVAVLGRPEFRLTPDQITDRLSRIVGEELADPNPAPPAVVVRPPAPPPAPPPPVEPVAEVAPAEPVIQAAPPPPVVELPVEPVPAPPDPPAVVAVAAAEPPRKRTHTLTDPDLIRVARHWADLPDYVKRSILLLVDAATRTTR